MPKCVACHVRNSLCGSAHDWPSLGFGPKKVVLGKATSVLLVPHIGEFDEYALFTKNLDYEAPVFEWLERNVALAYDIVVEVGANVGIYTIFFAALMRYRTSRLAKVVAFEPSPEAFARLLQNLRANHTAGSVIAFQAAVGGSAGLRLFFEPRGHLTNGSFVREFSEKFSDSIAETPVVMIHGKELERFFVDGEKALIKIDVEGYEPRLIGALSPLISKYRPDLLIEVLSDTAGELEASSALAMYDKFLLTSTGPARSKTLFASPSHRDWLLRWPA